APDQVSSRIELDVDYVVIDGFSRTRLLLDSEVSDNGEGDFTVSLENVPVGNHAIRVRGADGCGNVDVEIIEFCVTDQKAPTPICIGQLTVTLMPNGDGTGMAAIWANDFIASDVEDCSGEVTYSIYTEAEAQVPGFDPEPGRDGLILDCDSDATLQVRVYAFDPEGRGDFCSVFTLVQAADNACDVGGNANIQGLITTEKGTAIANVAVTIDELTEQLLANTDEEGQFTFNDMDLGMDYTLDANRDDYINHSQGVSTFDLVLITRFILGLDDDISSYQRLAADANADGSISVQDIISIRRLILVLDDAYRSNTAYRFVDAGFNFPVPENPWATSFPEVVNINNLPGNEFEADFIGIMIGDVDGTGLDNVRGRSADTRTLQTTDRALIAGNTYVVELTAASAAGLSGVQGTIDFGSAVTVTNVLDDVTTQLTPAELNATRMERGQLAFSFHDLAGLAADVPVLRLEITAHENTRLSEVLSFNDDLVFTEGYTATDDPVGLAFTFVADTDFVAERNELGQNLPNPVAATTTVPFRLTEASTVILEVRDLNGRLLTTRTREAASGNGNFLLNRKELGAAGVVTYTLTAGDFTATRKMIVR
ncbi:MAG: T9SS type A sorting domain-containing protein, partial [Bacteroidota bacterium]